jgi:hypothetical protein
MILLVPTTLSSLLILDTKLIRAPWHTVWPHPLKMTFFEKVGEDVVDA